MTGIRSWASLGLLAGLIALAVAGILGGCHIWTGIPIRRLDRFPHLLW